MDNGNEPESDVVDSEFVVASGQGPALLEPADDPLDEVTFAVTGLVKVLVAWLVFPRRNDVANMMAFQPTADPRVRIALVPSQLRRPAFAASTAGSLRPRQDYLERLRLMALARRHPHRQDGGTAVADQVDFGAETSLGTTQRMVLGFINLHRLRSRQPPDTGHLFFSLRQQRGWHG